MTDALLFLGVVVSFGLYAADLLLAAQAEIEWWRDA